MNTKKKTEYDLAYARENIYKCYLVLNRNTDAELIEFYKNLPNKAQWFKEHLRTDLEKQRKPVTIYTNKRI